MEKKKKIIVISAVNIIEGGALTILQQCLNYLDKFLEFNNQYQVIAIVHDRSISYFKNIDYIEMKKAKRNWFNRIYYEYIYFNKLSKKIKPYLWLSLHDTTPTVHSKIRAVYCHNPTPFYKTEIKDIWRNYKFFLFTFLYKYLYKINIKRNNYVIVQQRWIKDEFVNLYKLNKKSVIVAYPQRIEYKKTPLSSLYNKSQNQRVSFFYPSLSRPFKNFEVICEAAIILLQAGIKDFDIFFTINGTEDNYSKWVFKKYKHINNIHFIGRKSHEEVEKYYAWVDCLIFPSKLETWGLPISEFSIYKKPMIIANLPYAHETASSAELVSFFTPNNNEELAELMKCLIREEKSNFKECSPINIGSPFTTSWAELFDMLLK